MPAEEIVDNKKVWTKINSFIRTTKLNEHLKLSISSAEMFVGQPHHHALDECSTDIGNGSMNHGEKGIPKSYSLSRLTGANYKRNILAVERHKSISNEVLVNSASYFVHDDLVLECNNNDNISSLISAAGKTSAPSFGITKLDKDDMIMIRDYLTKAFKSSHHPLGVLNAKVSYCFYTSYGCWKVKPIAMLATQAMKEWESISKRIYDILRKLFPTLPSEYGTLDE